MLQHLVIRLTCLHELLQTPENIKNTTAVLEGFMNVLDMFYGMLTRQDLGREQSNSSTITMFCSSRVMVQKIATTSIFHHEIDRLLTLAELRDIAPPAPTQGTIHGHSTDSINTADTENIHDWQKVWNKMRRQQLRAFQKCLKDTEFWRRVPRQWFDTEVVVKVLKPSASQAPELVSKLCFAMAQAIQVLTTLNDSVEGVPNWFIPPYEVVLGKYIAQGSFGDVYHGNEVVVKVLKPSASTSELKEEDVMELFRREADYWFMLHHQNVVHLYGACHVGTPFFVCEPAKLTSLNAHVRSLAFAKPGYNYEEKGGGPSDIMCCLVPSHTPRPIRVR
ncbi:LOW QUALITY PROTEIN: TKL protein kinase [Phytophthora megakarya]|uniref:TKL protein kinase n=1 Tax=Phytophthora megakarya TaxID=4795 RepID=A0A225UUP0_9STRA|nr:LOW QUALITY PROTEIN: TKL protein kinase [Phytophthora megakarya]